MSPLVFDIVIVLILLAYAGVGYRRGLVMTAFSAVGFIAGALFALWALPDLIMDFIADASGGMLSAPWAAPLLLIVGIFVLGTVGQSIASRLAFPLRRGLRRGGIGPLDDALGSVLTVLVVIVAVWFAAGLLRGSAPSTVGTAVAQSQVLSAIDRAMPQQTDRLLGRVLVTLDRYGVPRAFDGLRADRSRRSTRPTRPRRRRRRSRPPGRPCGGSTRWPWSAVGRRRAPAGSRRQASS